MAIDLQQFERGEKFDGDYDAELKKLQERLARIQVGGGSLWRQPLFAFGGRRPLD